MADIEAMNSRKYSGSYTIGWFVGQENGTNDTRQA